MSLKLKDAKAGGNFVRPEPGTDVARCYSVIDLGTHTETTNYGIKTNRKLQVSWELPNQTHVFDAAKGAQPLAVHKRYNFVMGSKATLQIDLESWRGKKFTAEALESFEVQNLLGQPCVLNLVENESNGRTYTNVKSVSAPMKGQTTPEGSIKQVYYDVSMGKNDVYKSLPEFLQNYIATCEEWNGSNDVDQSEDDNFLKDLEKESADAEKLDSVPF